MRIFIGCIFLCFFINSCNEIERLDNGYSEIEEADNDIIERYLSEEIDSIEKIRFEREIFENE